MRISKSTKTSVTASSNYNLWSEGQLRSKMFEIGFNPNGLSKAEMIADLEQYDADMPKENTDVSSCKASTSTDKALQHIKAAIDILGNSGNRDDVTKDSIANLATVMFDIQGSTIKSSSYKTEIGGIKVTVTPRYSMGYEDGYDVSGKHSDGSDAGHKYYNMRNLGGKYYNAKGFDKDRAMSDLAQKFIDDIGWDNKMKMD